MNIYLDHAATTPLSQDTKEFLVALMDIYGNPSSLYSIGRSAGQLISDARKSTAKFINAEPDNIHFTGGGSASNTLGIKGFYSRHNCRILYSPIAHKSVVTCVKQYKRHCPLKVDRSGIIEISNLKELLEAGREKPFVIIDYANSEIGTIQNVKEIIDLVHLYKGVVYLDCTASIPSVPIDVKGLNIDMCGFSAHKLGGLKGCGVLYKRIDIELEPLIYGSQEQGLIGGTENVFAIASLGKAIENYDYSSVSSINRDYVYHYIIDNIPDSYLVGGLENRLKHNLYICFRRIEGESLMLLLDLKGIQVSTGSACNSGNTATSAVLSAIGIDRTDMHSCIRMTFNGRETKEQLDYVCENLKKCVRQLRELNEIKLNKQ